MSQFLIKECRGRQQSAVSDATRRVTRRRVELMAVYCRSVVRTRRASESGAIKLLPSEAEWSAFRGQRSTSESRAAAAADRVSVSPPQPQPQGLRTPTPARDSELRLRGQCMHRRLSAEGSLKRRWTEPLVPDGGLQTRRRVSVLSPVCTHWDYASAPCLLSEWCSAVWHLQYKLYRLVLVRYFSAIADAFRVPHSTFRFDPFFWICRFFRSHSTRKRGITFVASHCKCLMHSVGICFDVQKLDNYKSTFEK